MPATQSSPSLYAGARAVIVPGIEEFGITAVEAQAAGRPVIAAAAGGALETVLDGETGLLATPDDPEAFAEAIRAIDQLDFVAARRGRARTAILGGELSTAAVQLRQFRTRAARDRRCTLSAASTQPDR